MVFCSSAFNFCLCYISIQPTVKQISFLPLAKAETLQRAAFPKNSCVGGMKQQQPLNMPLMTGWTTRRMHVKRR